jgi:hypothetical protein
MKMYFKDLAKYNLREFKMKMKMYFKDLAKYNLREFKIYFTHLAKILIIQYYGS